MKLAYFDCFAGAGGDMIVGALLDAGADPEALRAELGRLKISGYTVRTEPVNRAGLGGTRFNVELGSEEQPTRHLSDIQEIIEHACLGPRVRDRAVRIFTRLAEAEAKVHRTSVQEVHFHEVGAIDSIVDVVAACVAMELLDIERVYCSAIRLGSGSVNCSHGLIPLPAPATLELVRGARTIAAEAEGEATTPTAAAVLTTLAESYGPPPAMELLAVGYGAGSRDNSKTSGLPNLLRVFIGRAEEAETLDSVVELSANIDDCTGEIIGAAIDKLLEAGCLDAWACPVFMKKSRPAWTLSALCNLCDVGRAERIIFAETTTFGIRRHLCERSKLCRDYETVETPFGPIRMKIGRRGGQILTAAPEFADSQAAAEAHHVPIKEVFAAAGEIYRKERNE